MKPKKNWPLSKRLRQARHQAGLSQGRLAAQMGVSPAYVAQLETCARTNPSIQVLRAWAQACGLTLGEML